MKLRMSWGVQMLRSLSRSASCQTMSNGFSKSSTISWLIRFLFISRVAYSVTLWSCCIHEWLEAELLRDDNVVILKVF